MEVESAAPSTLTKRPESYMLFPQKCAKTVLFSFEKWKDAHNHCSIFSLTLKNRRVQMHPPESELFFNCVGGG